MRGWDDPRLLTINGLRRRGYPAEAINAFCRDVGVTRNDNTVGMHRLEHHCRCAAGADRGARVPWMTPPPPPPQRVPGHAREARLCRPAAASRYAHQHGRGLGHRGRGARLPAVSLAGRVSCPTQQLARIAPAPPRSDKSLGSHRVSLTRTVFIEREDWRDVDSPDFYGLAPGARGPVCGVPPRAPDRCPRRCRQDGWPALRGLLDCGGGRARPGDGRGHGAALHLRPHADGHRREGAASTASLLA